MQQAQEVLSKKKWVFIRQQILFPVVWRVVGAVYRGGLENHCAERHRGFESLTLRNKFTATKGTQE